MANEDNIGPEEYIELPEDWDQNETEIFTDEEKAYFEEKSKRDPQDGIPADAQLLIEGTGFTHWMNLKLAEQTKPGAARGSFGSAMTDLAQLYLAKGDFAKLSWSKVVNSKVFIRVFIINNTQSEVQRNDIGGDAAMYEGKGVFPTYLSPRQIIPAGGEKVFAYFAGTPSNKLPFGTGKWLIPKEINGSVGYKINGSVFTIKKFIGLSKSSQLKTGVEAARSSEAKVVLGNVTVEARVEKNTAFVYVGDTAQA